MMASSSGAAKVQVHEHEHDHDRPVRLRRRRCGGEERCLRLRPGTVPCHRLRRSPGRSSKAPHSPSPSPSPSLTAIPPLLVSVFITSLLVAQLSIAEASPSSSSSSSSAYASLVPVPRRMFVVTGSAGGSVVVGSRARTQSPPAPVPVVGDTTTATPRPRHHHRLRSPDLPHLTTLFAAKGFGAASSSPKKPKKVKSKKKDRKAKAKSTNNPYVKSESDRLLAELAASSSESILGRTVASCPSSEEDPFWDMVPSLIASKFPSATDSELKRVAGFLSYALDPSESKLDDDHIGDEWRPNGVDEVHAYMPGLGHREPFLDTSSVDLCRKLEENYDTILEEYGALVEDMERRGSRSKVKFQSVTSMNYESGWKTLVLFYNGHRIPDFPYHLCPVTTSILETVPIAGRIAGFNRQKPNTGIPKHSDGNNMWLTCQMGVKVPKGKKAYIRVGPETRRWENGRCLLYDTTYEHETFNESIDEERVVLHVDFFNFLSMTALEVEVMQYIYELREKFMKAEGVAKVGAQIL